ncbi:MAG: AraC family transcriptional regulator [Sulfuricurvum sp.]|uniref:AraC family transcriptional regulator n=1 Tax=Sulfuricurvum sp. TaxID=2025608 RepID=UPI00261B9208|nr:AraC family transcriptional regulator [Sulfuricurvum sp.]MDD5161079.1 AraC family transcriptional regulator [Sulfuricurvum sp.]
MNTKLFDIYRQELIERIQTKCRNEGLFETEVPALSFYHSTKETEFLTTVYEPSLCVIVQGAKALGLGDEMLMYNPDSYLLASIHMPARVRIAEASTDAPYLSLKITFSMEQIFDVMKEIDEQPFKSSSKANHGLHIGDMSQQLLEPILRLARLMDTPKNIPHISPLIIKEILYLIINEEGGDFLRQYLKDGSATQRIVQVITKLKDDFAEKLDIESLAKSVSMSESSLYHNFKKITTMSPLQFQKTLRLKEARHILMTQNVDASQVAFDVGYESPSQFSREYSRMFGFPPKADIKRLMGDCSN